MNGDRASAGRLLDGLLAADLAGAGDVAVCPPFPYLQQVAARLAGSAIGLGAQNLSEQASGAYTGEVSGAMLRDCGCRYVILGHSERRRIYGETDALVGEKFGAARAAGLAPIVCVGEQLAEREAGRTLEVVRRQLENVLNLNPLPEFRSAVVAYEPVWAIGTGRTATPEQAQEVHAALRGMVAERDPGLAANLRIVYGGSVTPDNAAALFAMPDVDGGLVGGASLKAEQFIAICRAVRH